MQLECEDPNKITLEQRENKVNQHNPMCTMLCSPSLNLMPLPCQAKFLGMGSPPICQGRTKKNIKQDHLAYHYKQAIFQHNLHQERKKPFNIGPPVDLVAEVTIYRT